MALEALPFVYGGLVALLIVMMPVHFVIKVVQVDARGGAFSYADKGYANELVERHGVAKARRLLYIGFFAPFTVAALVVLIALGGCLAASYFESTDDIGRVFLLATALTVLAFLGWVTLGYAGRMLDRVDGPEDLTKMSA